MSPSLKPNSPSFSGSKSYKALQLGWEVVGLVGCGGLYGGGGFESPSSSESSYLGLLNEGFGFFSRGGREEAWEMRSRRVEWTPSRTSEH